MSNTADRVALTHPEHPDVVIYRLARQLPSLKRAGWREANLARLSRSLAKLAGPENESWREGFERLRQSYEAAFNGAPVAGATEVNR